MADHEKMRASDADRQEVIQRLRTALDEGRLKMDEYLDRLGSRRVGQPGGLGAGLRHHRLARPA
jgi:hypothetical protein